MRLLNAPRNEGGMALVVVLLFLTALAALTIQLTRDTGDLALQARNVVRGVEARAALRSARALVVALLRLDLVPKSGRLAWTQDGVRLAVRVEVEGGKVDLNAAEPEVIEALAAAALPGEPDRAARLAGAVIDWRDDNELRQAQGAEATDYRRAGRPFGPADGPFAHAGELRAVLGVTGADWERLAPAVTVATGRFDVDLEAAPPLVERAMTAVPGLTPEPDEATAAEELGEGATTAGLATEGLPLDPAGLYTLDAQAVLPSGYTARERVLVWVSPPDPKKEYDVLQVESALLPREGT